MISYELLFDAVDEYTMYQLRAEVNKHVSIALWIDEYNVRWRTTYLGIDGGLAPIDYTLAEKQEILTALKEIFIATSLSES